MMRAVTISQPFASLIADGAKWCVNRTSETRYRGPLLIHAGQGTEYRTKRELEGYVTNAIVAVCQLVDCVRVLSFPDRINSGNAFPGITSTEMQALRDNERDDAPFCWVLMNVRKLDEPVPCVGRRGLWVPAQELIRQCRYFGKVPQCQMM